MSGIVYRIIFPGLFGAGLFSLLFIICLVKYFKVKKTSKNLRGKHNELKKSKTNAILCAIVGLFCLFFSGYLSQDLLYKDFIVQEGIYESYNRDNDLYKIHFLVDGKYERCFVFADEVNNFVERERYEFVYAKRTGMLVSYKQAED